MAFSGYMFEDLNDIQDYLETTEGPTVQWAIQTGTSVALMIAQRLQCLVQVGFPRKEGEKAFNSVCLVSSSGLLSVYDKHFLYQVDETWATEGAAFQYLIHDSIKIGFGICMDLNPYRFESSFEAFEFANFHKEAKTQLLLCSMNWLYQPDEHEVEEERPYGDYQHQPAMSTIQYWAIRSIPLIEASQDYPILMVISNRIGKEKDTVFCGSSCFLHFFNGKAKVLGCLPRGEEGLLVCNLNLSELANKT